MASSSVTVKLDSRAMRDLLRDPEMTKRIARRHGDPIAAAAGPGYVVEERQGANRGRVSVRTDTPEAMRAEQDHGALTGALDAGRG